MIARLGIFDDFVVVYNWVVPMGTGVLAREAAMGITFEISIYDIK